MKSLVISLFFSVLLGACAGTPKISYFVLDAPALPAASVAQDARTPSILITSVTLPDLVDRPQMVVRSGANRVEILDASRWAQPLKSEVARVLAACLGREVGTAKVFLHGQGMSDAADYRVTLDIQRFDSEPGVAATIEALWTVRHKGAALPQTGRSAIREAVADDGPAALAAAHGRALQQLGKDIAAALR
ncbi:MAG: membrane integrity-associated transporter subunit PqiC [Sulfuricella sp.]|nr:membrane integrity-associated transporter subunit PqiC [Sulfuricella sp.]